MSLIKIATLVSTITALSLLIIKFTIGIISGSIAVLSSAIDSMLDMFVSVFNYLAVSNSEKNPDKKFNYGRGKIEAIAALFEGLVITLSGAYILYESVIKIINNEKITYLGTSLLVMCISIFITFGLVMFLDYVAKKTNNLVIKSDSLHYKTDLYSNAGILVGLGLIYLTGINYIDGIIGIFIAIYIIYSAFELIKKGFLLLLDVALDKHEVEKIKEIITSQKLVSSFHELRTRQSGNTKFVEVHVVFNPEIKLVDAHRISDHIESHIPKIDTNHSWEILVHMDPYDDCKHNEKK
ncbi:MAG: cation diffusion facilitator family transporter [Candidatus Gracilibacteria bacterium]|nr:cation diffusion facilitator family transporter [Candidatus Gracilibacteria bacterium]